MYRILLVEDDEALRYVYAHMHAWQENGVCLAAQAVNGKQALEQMDKERFDLIVTDIRMPFIDGLELLRELRRRGIQTPVILVSSYGEFEYAREGLVLGAFDYIVKPFREKQLNAVLSRAAQSLSAHTDEDSQYALVRETFETIGIPVQEDGFVHTLAAFLAAHLNGMITMEQAAEHLGLSKDYFGKRCRSHTGIAFGALYNQVRVAYARQLLRLIRKAPDIDRAYAPSDRKFVSDDNLFRIQAWIIRELAKSKPCIIIGKCANHILRDRANVLSMYVEAPRKTCVESIMQKSGVTAEQANEWIVRTDQYRAEYYKYYTGGDDWTNPTLYDLTVNTGRLSRDDAARLIIQAARIKFGEDALH